MQDVLASLDPDLGMWGRRITAAFDRGYARVELDRDNWVDRHRDAKEISAQFQAAVERCRDAGIWRIRLNGGSIRSQSLGDGVRWITLLVPRPYVKETVAALKAAESRGDPSRLDRLATKMAAPFDHWLKPGERYLRLGVDFTCTPGQFLTKLRGKAKSLGLQLNGRVDGNGVWVRPTRDSRQKLLRQGFPERYGDDVDPYGETAPMPSKRPPAPRRHRPSPVGGGVRYLPADDLERSCPCGWQDHGKLHDGQHTRWSLGIPIPPQVTFIHPIAVVDTMAPKRWRTLAYECARLARADGGYDIVSFPHPSNDPEPSDDNTRAYLFATRSHVIGYLSVDDSAFNRAWNFDHENETPANDTTTRPQVGLIFVANDWRRRGVAAALVRAMAADAGTSVAEISWYWPFSDAGEALARSLSPGGVWVS